MFTDLQEIVKRQNFDYRTNIYSIGEVAKYPDMIFIVFERGKYKVATTTSRNEIIGEKSYLAYEEAKQDFLKRISVDKSAFENYTKRGHGYPPLRF